MSEVRYNAAAAEVVRDYLTDDDWNFEFEEERGVFKFGLKLRCRLRNLKYVADIRKNEMLVYGYLPIYGDRDDPEMMHELSEYVTRVNYAIKNGNFEMDFYDGEIRYKSFIDLADTALAPQVIKNSIWLTAAMVERYGDGFGDIIFGNVPAHVAYAKYDDFRREPEATEEPILEDIFGNGEGDEE